MLRFFSLLMVIFSALGALAEPPQEAINIATFNLGLARQMRVSQRQIRQGTSYHEERVKLIRNAVAGALNQYDIDVLSLQELWSQDAIEILKTVHPDYELVSESIDAWFGSQKSLAFLVKKQLVSEVRFIRFQEENRYCTHRSFCDEGALQLTIQIQGRKIVIINAHLSPTIQNMDIRRGQAEGVAELIEKNLYLRQAKIVIATGSFNFSPVRSAMTDKIQGSEDQWDDNETLYEDFLNSPRIMSPNEVGDRTIRDCEDTYITSVLSPTYLYTQDKLANEVAATSLLSGGEPNQRNDFIFACGLEHIWSIENQTLLFDEKYKVGGQELNLSNHFGVLTSIKLMHQ